MPRDIHRGKHRGIPQKITMIVPDMDDVYKAKTIILNIVQIHKEGNLEFT